MNSIHGHEVMHMMVNSGKSFSRDSLKKAIHVQFGSETRFFTCSAQGMDADQLINFLENGNIKNSVNFPNTYLERSGIRRLVIINKNVPKMLGQILSVLADRDHNVADMINKSRGDIAYNLIDIEREPAEGLTDELEAIEGVISARIL